MRKLPLVFAIAAMAFVGCNNMTKKENASQENIEETETVIVDSHTSENSLDWAGVYEGTTPCADCEGIKTVLNLSEDQKYTLSMTYLGKPAVENEYNQKGTFAWDESGSIIILETEDQPMKMKVGENQVWLLDGDGNIIDGEIGAHFILKKK